MIKIIFLFGFAFSVPVQTDSHEFDFKSAIQKLRDDFTYQSLFYSAIQRLHGDLFRSNYNPAVRPVSNHSHALTVGIGLSYLHFDLDEFASVFHFNGLTRLTWRDERLVWNETLYDGLGQLYISINDIWKPDILLYNSAEIHAVQNNMATVNAILLSKGSIRWLAPTKFDALCELDLRNWPWDTQTCFLNVGSWNGEEIDLALIGDGVNPEAGSKLHANNPRWEVLSTRAELSFVEFDCCVEPHPEPEATFYLTFRRRSPMFVNTIVLPAIVLASFTLFTLWIPPIGSEKITVTLVNASLLFFYLMHLGTLLPAILDHQPAIVSFYGCTLVLVTLSMLFSIITIRMTRLPNPSGVPCFFRRLITGHVGIALCLGWAGTLTSEYTNYWTILFIGTTHGTHSLDEFASVFHLNGWTHLTWRDERLVWNETLYEGLKQLHVSASDIWKPDILLYNSVEMETVLDNMATVTAIASSNGSMLWVAPTKFNALCKLNFRHWPWDTQTCFLKLGSWTQNSNEVDLALKGDGVTSEAGSDLYATNPRWEVLSTSAELKVKKYDCCVDTYPDVTFFLTFRRRSPMFLNTIFLPAIVLASFTLFILWLPPNGSEKIIVTLVNASLLIFYLVYLGTLLPPMLDHQPAIVSFYGCNLVLVTLSLLFSIITIRMTRLPSPNGIPHVFKQLITGPVGKSLCLGWAGVMLSSTHKPLASTGDKTQPENLTLVETDGQVEPEHKAQSCTDLEWTLLVVFVDRILFLIYFVIFGMLLVRAFKVT